MTPADNITAAEPRPSGWRWFKELGGPWSMPQGQQLPWKRVEYHRVNEGVGQQVGARLGLAGTVQSASQPLGMPTLDATPLPLAGRATSPCPVTRGRAGNGAMRPPRLPATHSSGTRPAKSIAAEACPGISPKRNLGSAEGVGARHSTEHRRDNITRRREGCALR